MTKVESDRVEEKVRQVVRSLPEGLQSAAALLPAPLLHTACVAEELGLVQGLVGAGVAPDLYPETDDEDDEPPLTWMARYRDTSSQGGLEVVRYLIGQASDVSEGNALLAALESGDVSMARLLLAAGADTDVVAQEGSTSDARLLQELLQPYWRAEVETVPRYYVAFDEDQEICGVGLTEADAVRAANALVAERPLKTLPATETLVASVLRGEEFSWVGDAIGALEKDE